MTESSKRSRTPKEYAHLFGTGLAMGAADIVPGVSGGTMAFIMGIYEELINAIKSFNIKFAQLLFQGRIKAVFDHIPWQFLMVLFTGVGIAIITLANGIEWMLNNERELLFSFFFGLIVASIIAVGAKIRWSVITGIMLLVGAVVAFIIVNLIPQDMPNDPITLFFSGMIAIMAMILPGISGSFLLLILGQYDFVLESVASFNLLAIIPVGLGAIVGIMGFSRVLSWLLRNYEQATVATLVGFMIGSLWEIWPWKEVLETRIDRHGEIVPLIERNILPNMAAGAFWLALGLAIVGFVLVTVIDRQQGRST
ncbi:MAG: DUF368 domain-containing protein [Chloroflexi bacterium AL-W]|nr:DUF368 domain-containing protein [Chloroflexi bacterium AL-N1]NOK64730.1 DUF368 domain-containing protein [Chloroflexi bacterium AL-N10]NOK75971.1 DUF368 domain-containing protein [Chloroflexi bacterium AL-N5]NOK80270.1 DUF368 domain-containing protein [Chloroflexi bacterium AL-W]NOK86783.1 DUF368 domain-containing protein [Chloroflexi bacterium AL-N15]